jgi:hypothetical protein
MSSSIHAVARHILALAMIAVLAALAFVAGPAPAAVAATEWSVTPATAEGADGRVSLRHTVEPGAAVDDAIVVSNLGAEEARFAVSAGDGVVGDSGAFDIARGEASGAGAWIRIGGLDDGGLTLAPGEARVLPVTVTVPAGATPGDHPAGIVVGVSSGDDSSTVTTRLGVRLHLRVAGEVVPELRVKDVTATFVPSLIPFAPGELAVDYTIENAGNVRLGAAAAVRSEGVFGLAPTDVVEQAGELLPGDTVTREVRMDVAPLMVLFGGLEVSPLAVGEDEVTVPAATTVDFVSPAMSWTGLLAALVVIGLAAIPLVRSRRSLAGDRS